LFPAKARASLGLSLFVLILPGILAPSTARRLHPMSNRFPPLRSQDQMMSKPRSPDRALVVPAPVDLTLLAALVFVVALALI
jgi:hypothetical protein